MFPSLNAPSLVSFGCFVFVFGIELYGQQFIFIIKSMQSVKRMVGYYAMSSYLNWISFVSGHDRTNPPLFPVTILPPVPVIVPPWVPVNPPPVPVSILPPVPVTNPPPPVPVTTLPPAPVTNPPPPVPVTTLPPVPVTNLPPVPVTIHPPPVYVRIHPPVQEKKGRDLTQLYDKSPYTNRNVKRAKWQHKQRHKNARLHSGCGPI